MAECGRGWCTGLLVGAASRRDSSRDKPAPTALQRPNRYTTLKCWGAGDSLYPTAFRPARARMPVVTRWGEGRSRRFSRSKKFFGARSTIPQSGLARLHKAAMIVCTKTRRREPVGKVRPVTERQTTERVQAVLGRFESSDLSNQYKRAVAQRHAAITTVARGVQQSHVP
jgi:hypothetical protein